MKEYLLFLLIFTIQTTFSLKAQTKKYPADIEERIRRVENNLAGWVQTGENDTWTLTERMKKYNIVINVANLLSHTGGLTVSGFPGYAKGEILPSIQQILDGLKPSNTEPVRSSIEPGKSVIYSGGGVTISQLIVMDITNQPYDIFMKENVLDQLGMSSSSFSQPPPDSMQKFLATGYKADGREVPGKYHIYPEQAAAGLWTNPSDLCRYIIDTQLSYNGVLTKVLTPEMTRLRLTTVMEGMKDFVVQQSAASMREKEL